MLSDRVRMGSVTTEGKFELIAKFNSTIDPLKLEDDSGNIIFDIPAWTIREVSIYTNTQYILTSAALEYDDLEIEDDNGRHWILSNNRLRPENIPFYMVANKPSDFIMEFEIIDIPPITNKGYLLFNLIFMD
jgi:hypothetical protein